MSGGTDNHLLLLDLQNTGVLGKEAERVLDSVRIFTNKNMVPFDPRTPFNPSGIRIGTAALTTRGLAEAEMTLIGQLIAQVIKNINDQTILGSVTTQVEELTAKFPLYPNLKNL